MDEGGPTMEHRGKALLRHIVSKSPKPIILSGGFFLAVCVSCSTMTNLAWGNHRVWKATMIISVGELLVRSTKKTKKNKNINVNCES